MVIRLQKNNIINNKKEKICIFIYCLLYDLLRYLVGNDAFKLMEIRNNMSDKEFGKNSNKKCSIISQQ